MEIKRSMTVCHVAGGTGLTHALLLQSTGFAAAAPPSLHTVTRYNTAVHSPFSCGLDSWVELRRLEFAARQLRPRKPAGPLLRLAAAGRGCCSCYGSPRRR